MKNFTAAVRDSDYLHYLTIHYKRPHGKGDLIQACNGIALTRENLESIGCNSETIKSLDINYFKEETKPQWHNKCAGWVSFGDGGGYIERMITPRCVACMETFNNIFYEIQQFFRKHGKLPQLSWDGNTCVIERIVAPAKKVNTIAESFGCDVYSTFDSSLLEDIKEYHNKYFKVQKNNPI